MKKEDLTYEYERKMYNYWIAKTTQHQDFWLDQASVIGDLLRKYYGFTNTDLEYYENKAMLESIKD